MIWVLLIVVAVLVAVATAAVVVGRFTPDPMADPVTSTPHHGLPAGTIRSGDVAEVTFDTALRGYRMDQVDDVMDRLQQRIADLESEGRDTSRP
ncbi:DivIVA domain-containing protein [Janibacter cremeus]|uniref:DivIVA domain-containing protein n=1 Tax=Janibacter cremeus TaxID=1285192 RepID=UPI0023F6B451|nr:DivIVA domain-containing protein [Janibacter cremeus]WEV78093.1 DivIVA domain-containing protein [Janibacter cremeus]